MGLLDSSGVPSLRSRAVPRPRPTRPPMDFQAIKALVHDDLQAVNREIGTRLKSDVALINQLAAYIVNSGGKRIRPIIVLLGASTWSLCPSCLWSQWKARH